MKPQDAKVVADFLLTHVDHEMTLTTRVFQAVPPDRVEYRPDGLSKTALGLLRHITLEDEWILDAVANGAFGPLPDDSDACGILTPADATTRYQERIPAAAARVRALSGDELVREVD